MSGFGALIVAGGSGSRVGGLPKQYRPLAGSPVLRRTVQAFLADPGIALIQVVTGAGHGELYEAAVNGLALLPPVPGGATRQESVRNGLDALATHSPDGVLIHDAARPFLSGAMIDSVLEALRKGAEAVVPLLPVSDSLKKNSSGALTAVPRENLYRAQTPQGFRFAAIRAAHARFAGAQTSDDIALAEAAGMKIVSVAGEERNMKITTAADLDLAEQMLAGEMEIRTGSGFDVHRFIAGDHVWLCGVRIPHQQGLEGHSDADAGLHALTDAILGAISAGDIGLHFPPSDEAWQDAPSQRFLAHAADLVRKAGGVIVNCDVTLICEEPRIGQHREAMRKAIADILRIEGSRVSVKATTTDGLGFTGRGEGLAAQAVASVRLPRS